MMGEKSGSIMQKVDWPGLALDCYFIATRNRAAFSKWAWIPILLDLFLVFSVLFLSVCLLNFFLSSLPSPPFFSSFFLFFFISLFLSFFLFFFPSFLLSFFLSLIHTLFFFLSFFYTLYVSFYLCYLSFSFYSFFDTFSQVLSSPFSSSLLIHTKMGGGCLDNSLSITLFHKSTSVAGGGGAGCNCPP